MNNNGKIGIALVGGYLLGRTKKAKMALGLGLYLAGKKLNLNPQQLAKMVANSPVVGQLSDQVRKDLIGNTKSALTSAVTQRAGSLADSLHERTLDMNDPTRSARGSDAAADAENESVEDGREEDEEREERRERPRARKAPAAGGKTARTAKSSTRAAASGSSGGKSASGGARANGARKTASSGARKTAGGARKTAAKSASGGARKAANRGGGNG